MIYQSYQAVADMFDPFRVAARGAAVLFSRRWPAIPEDDVSKHLAAGYELMARAGLSHTRPSFDIPTIMVGNREVEVREESAEVTPFCTLLHFKKDIATEQPRVLLVAPMSGHFATLLRATVLTLLPDHDLYITDWHNARDIPLSDGEFGVDAYVDHLILFLEKLGAGAHIIAICQPSVQALAAVAVMAEGGNPARPASMTLMAGPIDTRINPTKVNEFATTHPIEWFEKKLISTVPSRHPGAMRKVYPGFLQLTGFMSMNLARHVRSHLDLYDHLVQGKTDKADEIRKFYDEYLAVMDLPAEFFLETIRVVFQEHALPKGKLTWHGNKVDPGAIRRTMLLTVEGERDDICSIGQTVAAQDLCRRLPPYMKVHHVQTGVGHYGVFSGKRWNSQIYPMVRDVIHTSQG